MGIYDVDPTVPIPELLDNLKQVAHASDGGKNTFTIPLGTLLVRLSSDADKTAASVNQKTQQLIVLTRWLIALTIAICVLTAPLVYIEVVKWLSE